MRYSNVDYAVVYVDPSKSSGGDGSTPAKAMNALPSSAGDFADNVCYLVRRTAEDKACTIPNGTNYGITNLMIVGMPLASDPMWELVPAEARTAWGSDSAQYANVKTSTSGCSFQAPYAQQFVLHRTYLFRDGVTADNYLLKFNNTSDFTGCFSFDHCKFGAKGVNLDSSSYRSEVTTNCICGYVYIYNARMVSVTDCVMAHGLCAYSSYPHGIYVRFAEVMNVDNVRVFSPAWTNSNQAYPLCLSEYALDGVECNVRNVTQTVRLNGTSGQYVPSLMAAQGYVSMNVENIVVKTGEPLSANRPTNYQVYNPLLNFQSVVEMSMRNVDLEYRDCWNARTTVLNLSRCYVSNYVPGIVKELKDIKVAMAREDGIGSPISYSYASQSGSGYAAVVMEFNSNYASVYAKVPQVDGLTVLNPRGKAFYGENIRLTDAEFEGSVFLKGSVADIRSVKTWFPGNAVNVYEGTHARVRKIVCNVENDVYPYNEDPAVGTTFSDNGSVFVDESNTGLRPMTAQTSKSDRIYQGIGCNNEGTDGHFAFRCANGLCDTWSVRRQGGGASALKLYNNACSNAGTMVLRRRPFNGMQLLPTSTGRHVLRAYVAFKGFAKPAEMYRHFFLSVQVGGRTYYSTLHGRWADDATSVWVNDSELTKRVLELPVDIQEVEPVDVRVYYSWYASGGFVYLDPDIKLTEA